MLSVLSKEIKVIFTFIISKKTNIARSLPQGVKNINIKRHAFSCAMISQISQQNIYNHFLLPAEENAQWERENNFLVNDSKK